MLYELHLTAPEDVSVESWSTACEAIRAKPLQIELTGWISGRRTQLMSAGTYECDTHHGLPLAQQTEQAVAKLLGSKPMSRMKLEIPLDKGIGVYAESDVQYHECHAKLLLRSDNVEGILEEALARGWVVSRNLLYTNVDGLEKWYLTKRAYDMPALQAAHAFNVAWECTRQVVGPFARMEMETVVFDSNPELDKGWA